MINNTLKKLNIHSYTEYGMYKDYESPINTKYLKWLFHFNGVKYLKYTTKKH